MRYGDWIGRWAQSVPDREALVDAIANRRLTYRDMARQITRMANYLRRELQIKQGDRVAVLALNRADTIILFFAASRLGAILVPLNHRLAPAEMAYLVEDAAPAALFFDAEHRAAMDKLSERAAVGKAVCMNLEDGRRPAWQEAGEDPLPQLEIRGRAPQLIIYTSGTTGLPKGVILTHRMILANAVNTHIGWDLRADDRTILHSALFYTAGWNIFTLPLFHCRAANVLVRGFDADLILDLIQAERVTVFFGVPTMYQMLLDSPRFAAADLSSIRFMVSGGAPLPLALFEAYQTQKGIRLWEGYGLTEAGPNNFLANGPRGSVGHPMPHVDMRLVDGRGRQVPAGRDGELLIRGEHLCAGYWNKPEESRNAIRSGWLHTGDLARMDDAGRYAIVGRKKDMFISGGINVYPAEIERVLETHPAVAAAAVIGVADEKWGEVGKAIVVPKAGAALALNEMQRFLQDHLGKFKIPKYLTLVAELPHTAASGKVQKFILQQRHGRPDNS
jgi:fatty-acyl-CoA synthase